MSDLFMDMHRRRRGWHNHQNTPPTSASTTTATTTSESPSSTQNVSDHIFSHHNERSTQDVEDAVRNANYKFNNRKQDKDDTHGDNAEDDDAFANILSLKLKKPKHWKWELTTSKSCTNIALPRILLYDHKGHLLVDAHGDIQGVYKEEDHKKHDKYDKHSHQSNQPQPEYRQRSATINLTHSIRKTFETDFNNLHIQEATPSPERNSQTSRSPYNSRRAIDFNTTDLPDYGLSRRSSSLRVVRFNNVDTGEQNYNESHVPEFLPTPPSTTTATSSSSGPREKRKYRRSHSSGRSSALSESILERFSYQKGRFSSPEFAEENEVEQSPRYFLRTCNAGTLVVKEDSFIQHPRRRKRPFKNRSTESLRSSQQLHVTSSSSERKPSAGTNSSPVNFICKKKQQPRCDLMNGNSLSNNQLSTSDEDAAVGVSQKPSSGNTGTRHLRRHPPERNQTKDLKYSTDVHQNGKVR